MTTVQAALDFERARKQRYQREWWQRRRAEWFEANGPCPCGSWVDLELHHDDPDSKQSHKIWSWSRERREAELAKCRVLCRVCHQIETTRQDGREALARMRALPSTPKREYAIRVRTRMIGLGWSNRRLARETALSVKTVNRVMDATACTAKTRRIVDSTMLAALRPAPAEEAAA